MDIRVPLESQMANLSFLIYSERPITEEKYSHPTSNSPPLIVENKERFQILNSRHEMINENLSNALKLNTYYWQQQLESWDDNPTGARVAARQLPQPADLIAFHYSDYCCQSKVFNFNAFDKLSLINFMAGIQTLKSFLLFYG